MEEKEKEMEAQLSKAKKMSDQDKAAKIYKDHAAVMETFQKELSFEKDRQQSKLEAALAARKRKKVKALKVTHEVQMNQEVAAQAKEKEDMQLNQMGKREVDILTKMLNSGNRRKAKGLIEKVLVTRQRKETSSLLQEQFAEVNTKLGQTLQETFVTVKERKEKIEQMREDEQVPFQL